MPFREVIICEKMNQALVFKKIFNLTQKKSFHGYDAVFYDDLSGLAVVSQSGHLLEQMPPQYYEPALKSGWSLDPLPVVPKSWRLQVKQDPLGRKNLQDRINGLLAGIKFALVDNGKPLSISIAVDNDKEGELLGWEVLDYFGLMQHPQIHRLIYSEMGEESMLHAYQTKQQGSVWFNRYLAGLARSRCDWLIGMNVTMGLSLSNKKMLPKHFVMNAGRVIFAMVHILNLRHQEVISFVKTDYFNIKATFVKQNGVVEHDYPFTANLTLLDEWLQDGPGDTRYLIDKSKAQQLVDACQSASPYKVLSYETKAMSTKPPLGFARTPFDSWMVKYHGASLSDIADALQSLYSDKALITYPRVEADKLDLSMHPQMPNYINAIQKNIMGANSVSDAIKQRYTKIFAALDLSRVSDIFAEGVNTGESHHAIIPTSSTGDLSKLTPLETLVYFELVDRLLMQFLPDYEYNSTKVRVGSGDYVFSASGTTPLKTGWKAIERSDDEEEGKEENSRIPPLSVGDIVDISDLALKASETKKPQYYQIHEFLEVLSNPKKFVKNKELMSRIKKLQIGTGNTRSSHVSDLAKRGLSTEQVEKKGKKSITRLLPTKKMLALSEVAPEYFKYPEMSAYWEDAFNRIQDGELSFDDFMSRQEGLLRRFDKECKSGLFNLKSPITNSVPCRAQNCHGNVFRMLSKQKKNYWACNSCDARYADNDGVCGNPFVSQEPPKDAPTSTCPSCNKTVYQIERISKSTQKPYKCWTCPSCKSAFFDDNGSVGKPFGAKPADDGAKKVSKGGSKAKRAPTA